MLELTGFDDATNMELSFRAKVEGLKPGIRSSYKHRTVSMQSVAMALAVVLAVVSAVVSASALLAMI